MCSWLAAAMRYTRKTFLPMSVPISLVQALPSGKQVDSGSVKVVNPVAADTVRRGRPDRVMNSRMVRRCKPQEGTFQKPKAKSRWCVLEHQDPDATDMFTYAPTPQTESIMLFVFSTAGVWLDVVYRRPQKVYGLNDVPPRWHRTLAACLMEEPCLYAHDALGGSVVGLILIEVDDQAVKGCGISTKVPAALRFGKWENGSPATQADESGNEVSSFTS